MGDERERPFENIESALEYIDYLLEASQEAEQHVDSEIALANSPEQARHKQALQIIRFKLASLDTHIIASKKILNDLRKLRRLILEERKVRAASSSG